MHRGRHYFIVISITVLLIISLLPELGSGWNSAFSRVFTEEPPPIPEDTIVEYIGLDSAFLAQFTPLESGGSVSIKDTILEPQKPVISPNTNTSPVTSSNSTKPSPPQPTPQLSPPTSAQLVRFRQQLFDTYTVDLRKESLQIYWKDEGGNNISSIGNLQNSLQQENHILSFATNAGIFDPAYRPEGLFVENGAEKVPLNLSSGQGNFYLKPNGVFFINEQGANVVKSESYPMHAQAVSLATQSGPMLLINGQIHPAFRKNSPNTYIRNGVGIISPHKVVFIISRQPVNFYDFASLFKYGFNCQNALYLDGAISQMYVPELGRYDATGNFAGILAVTRSLEVLP